ncbi:hypothetical protein HG530_011741 [Fusarium avenaceum]|nr:hypothetical protein DER45DRAFT_608969 [Fusarium avenaceum]KAI6756005.1 hypothetical protein HG530_011741 [Fusarium avenaceum]
MHFLKALLLANPDKTIQEMHEVTKQICNDLGEDDCYCSHWAEYSCDPFGDNIQKFKEKCEKQGENWYWNEC